MSAMVSASKSALSSFRCRALGRHDPHALRPFFSTDFVLARALQLDGAIHQV
jgi:hypothetical protein